MNQGNNASRTDSAKQGRVRLLVCGLAVCAALSSIGCQPDVENVSGDFEAQVRGRGVRVFVGQDVTTIAGYASNVGTPLGVVGYTSLRNLEGLGTLAEYGTGPQHLAELSRRYPDAHISIGLHILGELDAINRGELDAQIAKLAEELGAYNVPVLLRVGYEFDAEWVSFEPEPYKLAFRRIVEKMRPTASNVEYVWQSFSACGRTYKNYPLEAWYPGDQYVDWFGVSLFSEYSDCQFSSQLDFAQRARDAGKEFFVAEATPRFFDVANQTYSRDGETFDNLTTQQIIDRWYGPVSDFIRDTSDVLKGFAYINANWEGPDQTAWTEYWGDARVQSNPEILEYWRSMPMDATAP